MYEYQIIYAANMKDDEIQHDLNQLGKNGWRLIVVSGAWLYLERQLPAS